MEQNPQESKAKLDLAYVLLKQKRLLDAYNLSFDVAKAEPKNSYAFAVLGRLCSRAGILRMRAAFCYRRDAE